MKRLILAALLATTTPLSAAPLTPSQVTALRDAALKDDHAWDIVEGLTTEVGARLAGTEAEARARAWAVASKAARIRLFMRAFVRGQCNSVTC